MIICSKNRAGSNLFQIKLRRNTLLVFICLLTVTSPLVASDKAIPVQLTGEKITQTFANVRDHAEVQDSAKTRAENTWCANGQFISRWRNAKNSGVVTGTWRVKEDLRCITILSGVESRIGKESCSPVFKSGSKYLSKNQDGTIHGIHTLSSLQGSSCPD